MTHKLFSSLMIVLILTACAPATSAPAPTTTPVPATSTATIISTPTLGIGSTLTSDKDGMTLVFVPAGEFTMGSETYDNHPEEKPIHKVNVDAFWIDQTEVTNAMYAKCVADGICKEPTNKSSASHPSYYDNPEFDRYPVSYVDWNMAKTYCEWAGRRLPTEAEWEKAARGTDARTYPWGEDISCSLANYWGKDGGCVGDTTEVGSYMDGASAYGALDMAGNVLEWVSSVARLYPYEAEDGRESLTSDARVLRGGSWDNDDNGVRSASRHRLDPAATYFFTGFRCSHSPSAVLESTSTPFSTAAVAPTFTPIIELSPTLNSFQQLLATRQAERLLTGTPTPVPTRVSASTPEVIAWEGTISLPIASSAPFDDARGQQLIFHNGYVYIFGGASVGEPRLTNVYFSAIKSDGTLAGWMETTSLPGKYYDHVVVKVGEYVYLLTGADGAEDVYYAPLNTNGSIGAWKRTASLSPSRQQFAAVSHGNFIYTTGGNSGGNQAFVQYASVRPDGSLNNWSFTTPLPAAIQAHTMIAYDGYLYVFGGKNTSDRTVVTVYYSAIQPNGRLAAWKTTTPMPRQMSGYSTFESNGHVYLIGGSPSFSYSTRILEDHTLEAWKEAASLPNKNIHGLRTGAYNGFAYAMGGYKNGYQRLVYYGFIGSETPPESPTPAPATEAPSASSTRAPQTLTPGPLTCQLDINQTVHVLDGTNLWSQPDVVDGSLIGTLPAGTSVYVISAPAWGRILETGVSGWWWEISNESNGASAGWIWEGRIEECN